MSSRVLFLLLLSMGFCMGLYEDQAFKMDWVLENLDKAIGGVALGDGGLVILSRSGLLGRIQGGRGKLLWRQSLEPLGRFLDIDERNGVIRTLSSRSPGVLDLRTWNPAQGDLIKEDLHTVGPIEEAFLYKDKVVVLEEGTLKTLDVSEEGAVLHEIPIPPLPERRCKRYRDILLYCTDEKGSFLGYFDLQRMNAGWKQQPIEDDVNLMSIFMRAEGPLSMKHGFLATPKDDAERLSAVHPCDPSSFMDLSLVCHGEKCSVSLGTETRVFKHPRGDIENFWMTCDTKNGDRNAVFLFQDGSLVGNGWIRNEGLGNILQTQILPFLSEESQTANTSEEEGSALGGVFRRFVERLTRHGLLLKSKLENMFMREVNDFGIRKVIVAATRYGKVYGLDSKNGKILWQVMVSHEGFEEPSLFILRSDGVPLVALLFKDASGVQFHTFNSMSGRVMSRRSFEGRSLSSAFSLHFHLSDDIRPVMIVFGDGDVEVEPSEEKVLQEVNKMKTYVLSLENKNTLVGNRVENVGGKIRAVKLWDIALTGSVITKIVPKPLENRVHSLGRVMADRSVLFKYVNPNLVAVFAESAEVGAAFSLLLVDMVSGRILFSLSHKRVSGPFSLVHSENWIVYSYYNEKSRRTELGSLELFEGQSQVNTSRFSSFQNTLGPFIERQSYILGHAHILAMADTTTEKAITSKHILLATSQGIVYNVPRSVLDPRRPNMNTPSEMREPGLLPYIPELHLSPETVLNYNRTLLGPRKIFTAATGLESTSVVFVQGVDLYCTQVHPSKGFDLLKDDFDYYVIASVLLGLVIAAFVTKKLAQNKNVKQAWK